MAAVVSMPRHGPGDAPIHLLFVSTAAGRSASMAHPRVLVVAGRKQPGVDRRELRRGWTRAGVLHERRHGDRRWRERAASTTTSCSGRATTAFHIGASARTVPLARRAIYLPFDQPRRGAGPQRRQSRCSTAKAPSARSTASTSATAQQLVDNHTTIDHAKPHCASRELYKGILADRARGVFNGKIIVRPDAQKTDAKQTNKALLLSEDAQINTKPQLEIFADDVKCTHGAAIGQLDDDAIFYLRSRGLSEREARRLLIRRVRRRRAAAAFRSSRCGPSGSNRTCMQRLRRKLQRMSVGRLRADAGPAFDVERDPARLSDPCDSASTASRSSTSTTRRRRRSRRSVIDRLTRYYAHENANVHRGVHL